MKTDVQSHSVDVWLNETKVPDEFVVVVAFGTLIKLPEKIWQTIADTLQLVPQMRLLLVIPQDLVRTKIETSVVSALDQPSRVFISGWIPQQRVLAHPSVRMFITHGGLNSIGEAVYTHVPLIIIPGYGDQPTNAAKVQESNIGYMLERHQITTARLADTIKLLHADHDRFVVNLRRIHQLCLMEGGAERASTLIDGWLLTGYDHEITLKHKLPFLVATSLDVQLTLFVFIILTTYLICRVSKFIVYLLCPYKKYKRE
jgi:UDP:flavonoid glycosyltransferase YjiC (YdhE family)